MTLPFLAATMGCTENKKFSFLGFFEFLVSRREMGDEKSIFYIFCLILAKVWPFLMIFQSILMVIHIFAAPRPFWDVHLHFLEFSE